MKSMSKILLLALVSLAFGPVLSYADWDHDQHDWHHGGDRHDHDRGRDRHHPHFDARFAVWPDTYFYNGPYYPSSDQVLEASSVFDPVVINGQTYYLNNGNYYIYNGYGYQSVPPPVDAQEPVAVEQPQPEVQPVAAPAAPPADNGTFTVNIPKKSGGYTAVTLKKSGDGYVGPQGEFYSQFPKVSQLEAMYGND